MESSNKSMVDDSLFDFFDDVQPGSPASENPATGTGNVSRDLVVKKSDIQLDDGHGKPPVDIYPSPSQKSQSEGSKQDLLNSEISQISDKSSYGYEDEGWEELSLEEIKSDNTDGAVSKTSIHRDSAMSQSRSDCSRVGDHSLEPQSTEQTVDLEEGSIIKIDKASGDQYSPMPAPSKTPCSEDEVGNVIQGVNETSFFPQNEIPDVETATYFQSECDTDGSQGDGEAGASIVPNHDQPNNGSEPESAPSPKLAHNVGDRSYQKGGVIDIAASQMDKEDRRSTKSNISGDTKNKHTRFQKSDEIKPTPKTKINCHKPKAALHGHAIQSGNGIQSRNVRYGSSGDKQALLERGQGEKKSGRKLRRNKVNKNNSYDTSKSWESSTDVSTAPSLALVSSESSMTSGSRYLSSLRNSPYYSSSYSGVSTPRPRGYLSDSPNRGKRLALPAVNSKGPVQLTCGAYSEIRKIQKAGKAKKKSGDIPNTVEKFPPISKKNSPKKRENSVSETIGHSITSDGKTGNVTHRRDQSNVPILLKSQALYQNGQLEVAIVSDDNGHLESENIDMKITLVHKHIAVPRSQLPRRRPNVVKNKGKPKTGYPDPDIIKNRALYPSFNNHTNPEASERHLQYFGL